MPLDFIELSTKRPDKMALKKPLYDFLKEKYNQKVADDYEQKLVDVSNNRKQLLKIEEASIGGAQGCLTHAANMKWINEHFPISTGTGMHRVELNFSWFDSFSKKRFEQKNVYYELASTIYNVAIIESQMAARSKRNDIAGKKKVLGHLSKAVGYLEYILEHCKPKIVEKLPVDLSTEALGCLKHIFIAQGTQVWFELAKEQNKQLETLASLATKVADSYSTAAVVATKIAEALPSTIVDYIQFNKYYWTLTMTYYCGKHYFERAENEIDMPPKYGVAINFFQHAIANVSALQKLKIDKNQTANMNEMFSPLYHELLPEAKKKNAVWEQPEDGDLPSFEPKEPFKGKNMDNWLDTVESDNPFADLFPMHVMEAKTKYVAKREELIMNAQRYAREHRDHINTCMTELGLPGLLIVNDTSSSGIPENIRSGIQETQQSGGYNHLSGLFDQLKNLATVADGLVERIEKSIQGEAEYDFQLRSKYRDRWSRQDSFQASKKYHDDLTQQKEKLKISHQTDATIAKAFSTFGERWNLFSNPISVIESQLPKPDPSFHQNKSKTMMDLQKAYDEMTNFFIEEENIQSSFAKDAHEHIENDLVQNPSQTEKIIESHLKTIKQKVETLEKLSAEEDKCFSAIKSLVETLNQNPVDSSHAQARQKSISELVEAISRFQSTLGSLKDGIHFYTAMQEYLKKFLQTVLDFCKCRELEAQDMKQMLETHQSIPSHFNQYGQSSYSLPPQNYSAIDELNRQRQQHPNNYTLPPPPFSQHRRKK